MCGIVGLLQPHSLSGDARAVLRSMADTLRHRGPDDSDVWLDEKAGLGLGHCRLSILDLSPEGHQPMVSASGRYVISYNGEVYNFAELRTELEHAGAKFRGHSDTEVLLAAIEAWGVEQSVRRFVGMFAFGLWDRQERLLYLVRDRLGIKPLYFGWSRKTFLFSSELKSFLADGQFKPDINREALALFMRYAYVPAPLSMYRNIFKLPAGCWLAVGLDQINGPEGFSPKPEDQAAKWKPVRYWSARDVAEQGCATPFRGSETEAIEKLDRLLRQAVRLRMVSDVPLGAFLSGGIDSSTVVALMQAQSNRPVKTFSVGFREADYDEARYASGVARHLGTDHTELYVTPAEAQAVIPRLPTLYDEPFADSSQIPTFLVSELARRQVTVSLSGDGGDEVFAGYNRYFLSRRIWRSIGWMPRAVRRAAGHALQLLSPQAWDSVFRTAGSILPTGLRVQSPGDKLQKLASVLAVDDQRALYWGLVSIWKDPSSVVIGATEPPTIFSDMHRWAHLKDFRQQMMFLDTVTYLPDDILVKVDRASMGVSLEARVPLLDHRVVEFAWRLPVSMKFRHGQGKWALRKVLERYVPGSLIDRPKMGFGVPIDSWLRGPLRDWAESLLDESRLRREGFFHPRPILEKWSEHLSGSRNWQYPIWNVLMFQAWREHNA